MSEKESAGLLFTLPTRVQVGAICLYHRSTHAQSSYTAYTNTQRPAIPPFDEEWERKQSSIR